MSLARSDSALLRWTTEADLDYLMGIEREAAAERFVGQWSRERHIAAFSERGLQHITVESAESGGPVGFLLLKDVDSEDRCVLLKRIVIGPKGKGFGRQTLRLVKQHVFESLKAHRLWLDVLDFNERARRLYLAEGFREEGTLRECVRGPDGYETLVVMGILEDEYRGE